MLKPTNIPNNQQNIYKNNGLFRVQPCKFMPKTFERSPLVMFQPPRREPALQYDQNDPHQHAHRDAAESVQTKSPTIKKESAYNGLPDVICEAHFPVRSDFQKSGTTPTLVKKSDHKRYYHTHHGQITLHRKQGGKTRGNNRNLHKTRDILLHRNKYSHGHK